MEFHDKCIVSDFVTSSWNLWTRMKTITALISRENQAARESSRLDTLTGREELT